jgi:hypothetical protein
MKMRTVYLTIAIVVISTIFLVGQPTNDSCTSAIEIFCGDVIDSNNIGASTEIGFGDPDCGFPIIGPAVWFKIEGTGQSIVTRLSDTNAPITYQVYRSECDPLNCIVDPSIIADGESIIETEIGLTYFILIGSIFRDRPGNFTFSVGCSNNDDCENAINIKCGDTIIADMRGATVDEVAECRNIRDNTLWYRLVGTGDLYEFSMNGGFVPNIEIDVSNLPCGEGDPSLNCPFFFFDLGILNSVFSTVENQEYFIAVSDETSTVSPASDLSISINCITPASNNDCENPELIQCGESFIGNFRNASQTQRTKNCFDLFGYSGARDLWYEIIGDGDVLTFTNSFIKYEDIYFRIIDPTCIPQLDGCVIEEFRFSSSTIGEQIDFQTELDKNYLVQVTHFSIEDVYGDFEVALNCTEINSIPTMSQWALISLILLLLIIPVIQIKNHESIDIVNNLLT